MSGPLSAVLAEIGAGTPTVSEMVRHTGFDESVVRAAMDHLIRSGRVEAKELAIGCPPSGCGSCAAGSSDGTPGCGASAAKPGSGHSVVTLSLVRHRS